MCMQCVATGAVYAGPGLLAVRAWAKRRPDLATDDDAGEVDAGTNAAVTSAATAR
jgi:hypothetical protein